MTAALQAENYRILYVNTDSVRIGGRMLSAGDIFKETEDIQWTEDLQSIKVIGTDSRQILVLVAKEMEGKNKKSVFDYLMPVNAMSMAYRSEIFSIILEILTLHLPFQIQNTATAPDISWTHCFFPYYRRMKAAATSWSTDISAGHSGFLW